MKGFSQKITVQILDYIAEIRSEQEAAATENQVEQSSYLSLFSRAVSNIKEQRARITIRFCADVELDARSSSHFGSRSVHLQRNLHYDGN